ncbi:hypothetical protein [Caballeronia glathei]|uniref:Uncharacterized protein n=1 Tax=Caballeronia glathei TaxID=60547 RepID=A0A069PDY8_9BURK|nr:hypothetical protein [Caballeronia glathei]KDR38712.1 hypothetical protein BG61_37780 [Caballeronia glathei]
MPVNATPMRERGKALDHYEVQKAPGVRSDMIVLQEKSTALNCYSNIARFQVNGVDDPKPTPPLHNAVRPAGERPPRKHIRDVLRDDVDVRRKADLSVDRKLARHVFDEVERGDTVEGIVCGWDLLERDVRLQVEAGGARRNISRKVSTPVFLPRLSDCAAASHSRVARLLSNL